jgi:hypothetical protein
MMNMMNDAERFADAYNNVRTAQEQGLWAGFIVDCSKIVRLSTTPDNDPFYN